MFLLDTNVVCELRSLRPNSQVVTWLKGVANAELYLSALTLEKIKIGNAITRQHDPAQAAKIQSWIEQLAATHNVLPVDAATLRLRGRLMSPQSYATSAEGIIAATAHIHKLTVVTRNVSDFKRFKVPVFNPYL